MSHFLSKERNLIPSKLSVWYDTKQETFLIHNAYGRVIAKQYIKLRSQQTNIVMLEVEPFIHE